VTSFSVTLLHPLRDIIPADPSPTATVAPTTGSYIPELGPVLYTYLYLLSFTIFCFVWLLLCLLSLRPCRPN